MSEQKPEPLPEKPPIPTPEQRQQMVSALFNRWIGEKWGTPVICPVCKTTKWTIQQATNLPVRYPAIPGHGYVLIPVTCDNCQNAIFFNASGMGFFNEDGTPKSVDERFPPTPPEPLASEGHEE